MSASSRKQQQQQHVPVVTGPMVFLANITGRTPAVPGNVSAPGKVRLRPTDEQVNAAPQMAAELANETVYREDFGKRAPDPKFISAALLRACALSNEVERAEAWVAYLKGENAAAWEQALGGTNTFQSHYELAEESDPEIAHRYPGSASFYNARSKSAERAVATRKRKEADAKKNAPK